MSPSSANSNIAHSCGAYTEGSGNDGIGSDRLTNLFGLFFCQFGLAVSVASVVPNRLTALIHHIVAVFLMRPEEKVGWIHAGSNVTFMADQQSTRELTFERSVRLAMRQLRLAVPCYVLVGRDAVTIRHDGAQPKPAARIRLRHRTPLDKFLQGFIGAYSVAITHVSTFLAGVVRGAGGASTPRFPDFITVPHPVQ